MTVLNLISIEWQHLLYEKIVKMIPIIGAKISVKEKSIRVININE